MIKNFKFSSTLKTVLLTIGLISCFSLMAQNLNVTSLDLKKLQWKNRVIIIKNDINLVQQKELFSCKKELLERKVKIFSKNLKNQKQFKVFLIGLDGGEKAVSVKVQPCSFFIKKIDQMPMRQNEMLLNLTD